MARGRRCVTCRWWGGNSVSILGDCHRYPPGEHVGSSGDAFPVTQSNDWCGEHDSIPLDDVPLYQPSRLRQFLDWLFTPAGALAYFCVLIICLMFGFLMGG